MQFKRKAFTMIELIIASAILAGVGVVAVLNLKLTNQTAQREAEKVVTWLNRQIQKSDRMKQTFSFIAKKSGGNYSIDLTWEDKTVEILNATPGCKYESEEFIYSVNQTFNKTGSIKITGSDESIYYVVISSDGRARLSANSTIGAEETAND
ncbi:MAG: type II secretion system protein [Synergistaceae bacterium]|nr:type II secretion system protein [Synergistaceae bacterium]